jgi:hypothetical protein
LLFALKQGDHLELLLPLSGGLLKERVEAARGRTARHRLLLSPPYLLEGEVPHNVIRAAPFMRVARVGPYGLLRLHVVPHGCAPVHLPVPPAVLAPAFARGG